MIETLVLPAAFFLIAMLYSSVGHAGASGYLAAMALAGIAAEVMKPAALCMNILVATITLIRFYRAGAFSWPKLWPFVVGSIPAAYVGGAMVLPGGAYRPIVGIVLLWAAVRLFMVGMKESDRPPRSPNLLVALLIGIAIGLLSGLTGTGGGIFLSPVLILMHWAATRETAGISAAFILCNSISGLTGNLVSVGHLPTYIFLWMAVAGIGGLIGAGLGSKRFDPVLLRRLLAVVLVVAGCKLIFSKEQEEATRYNGSMRRMTVRDMPVPMQVDANGTARVGSTRVTLDSVVYAYRDGSSAEEIVEQFPTLPLADIHAVIAYYLTHRGDVEEYLRSREVEAEALRRDIEARSDQRGLRERLLARQSSRRQGP